MNKKIIFTLCLVVAGIATLAQNSKRCSHKIGFEKSAISDTLDALHYYINLTVTDFTGKEISGYTEIEMTTKVDNTNEVKLELMDLTVDSIFIDNVENTIYSHTDNILTIPLTASINPGDIVMVRVHYHGVPFHESWGGFHWAGQYAYNLGVGISFIPHNLGKTWFPCIDDFQDRAYYDLFVTVEEGKDAVCGGLLVEIINNGNGTNTFHWTMNHTIPTYLASVAVGDYAKWTDTYNGIEEDIPIEIWVRPGDSSKVDGSFANLNEILALYEDKFGPYRWERVGYVGTSVGGAMEHATNIAYMHGCINGNLSCESLLAHELSHMWFGDNVTCSSAEEMWLNEGWAVFSDALMQEALYGKEQYKEFLMDMHKGVLHYCHTSSNYGDGSYCPLNQIPQDVTYGMSAYDKGATVAHSLRGYLGDEVFFETMAAYNEHFKYNYASSYDMRDFLTSHTGIDMSHWFEAWVFTSGTPHYSVDSFSVVPTDKGADVTVYMKQKHKGPEDYISDANISEITFMDNNWQQFSDTIHFDGETGSSVIEVPFIPEVVLCDLNERFCDATTDLAKVINETGDLEFDNTFFELEVHSILDSAFLRVEHNWAPPDSLKTPVQGLRLSDYRYWKIDGIHTENFIGTGSFRFSKNGHLENTLIFSSEDSVVMMYREGTWDDWQFVGDSLYGSWYSGFLFVDSLKKGEYTLAVCDSTFISPGIGENINSKNINLKIYPNPSKNIFNIKTSEPGLLKFYDINGKIVDTIEVSGKKHIKWEPKDLPEGTYFVRLISQKNRTIAVEKLIYKK